MSRLKQSEDCEDDICQIFQCVIEKNSKKCGFDTIQGDLIAKITPISDIREMLEQQTTYSRDVTEEQFM